MWPLAGAMRWKLARPMRRRIIRAFGVCLIVSSACIASAGVGLGTLVVPILAGWLLPMLGWRSTFIVFAVGALVLGGCAVSLIESDPARRGLAPDGTPPPPGGPTLSAPTGITLRAALGTRQFWYFFAAILGCAMGLFIPFAHLAPYARDHGHSEQIAAALIGAIGLGSLIGRFALAGLSDRISRPLFLAVLFAGMALMLALWLASTGVVPLAIFAVVFGALYGGFVALAPALTMDYFGGRSVAGIIGALYSAAGIGNLIGPWLAGVAFDIRGSYDLPIIVSIACMLIASGFALLLRRQPSLTK